MTLKFSISANPFISGVVVSDLLDALLLWVSLLEVIASRRIDEDDFTISCVVSEDEPELVNSDPYGEGWMIKLKLSDKDEVSGLLSEEAYKDLVG